MDTHGVPDAHGTSRREGAAYRSAMLENLRCLYVGQPRPISIGEIDSLHGYGNLTQQLVAIGAQNR